MKKTVCYTFLVYPESAKIDDVKAFMDLHEWEYIISPLHNMDVKEDNTGELKKEHYHVAVGFDGHAPKYIDFKKFIESVGGVVPPMNKCQVYDPEALTEYMSHDDLKSKQSGKAHYDKNKIVMSDGWNPASYLSYVDRRELKRKKQEECYIYVIDLIHKEGICSFKSLVHRIISDPSLLKFVMDRAYSIKLYLYDR